MQADFDKDLLTYFTDAERLREIFKNLASAPTMTKRLLIIHGVGGVGKSSLLRMFRLHCKSVNVPVALASGDDSKSALDVLTHWTEDLKADKIAFPSFGKTFEHYRAIQAKVDEQAKKTAGARAADIAGKAASKTAEAAGGALAGAAIGSVIPGIGTAIGGALGGVLGGMGAEALVDWLRGFLTKPDIDLLLDPAKKLTDDFLADVAQAADKRRIVLMLDTFEQMTALEDWARDVAQRLSVNVLFVIAGRALPNWGRAWSGWMANAQVEELKPMSEDVMRELIQRYYATMRGGEPNPTQVDAIIRFARGLPMVVTSAVQLWVKYGVEDFQSVKAEIVANLVDRLMEGVPTTLIPALEAAAVVRWFDQPILRAVLKQDDVRDVYNELRRFPFVRTRVEGLALHDAVREIMDENLRTQDSERHCELHERAAAYFEKRLEKATGEEAERLELERLYHRVRADEEAGIKLFQEMAEELTRYRLVNRLRALLNDANTYPLERENNRLWREYYGARLAHLEMRLADAEKVYQLIGDNEKVSPKLRAYALCDWGEILYKIERLSLPGGKDLAYRVVQQSIQLASEPDYKTISNYFSLRHIADQETKWHKSIQYTEKAYQLFLSTKDQYGLVTVDREFSNIYALTGQWQEFLKKQGEIKSILDANRNLSALITKAFAWTDPYIWMGRYHEAQYYAEMVLRLAIETDDPELISGTYRCLGYALGMQLRSKESDLAFHQTVQFYEKYNQERIKRWNGTIGFWWAILLIEGKLDISEGQILERIQVKKKIQDFIGIPELLDGLAQICEIRSNWEKAEEHYRNCLDLRWTGRRYFESAALTGLVRVKHALGDYAAIPPLLAEAEQLAQQYEYNDHLASLRLTQAQTSPPSPPSPTRRGGRRGRGRVARLFQTSNGLCLALQSLFAGRGVERTTTRDTVASDYSVLLGAWRRRSADAHRVARLVEDGRQRHRHAAP